MLNLIPVSSLTPDQKHRWAETRTAIIYTAPMFSHLLYSMLTGTDGEQAWWSPDHHTAATDGEKIVLHPVGFLDRPLDDRLFILAHKICHAMFGHPKLKAGLHRDGFVVYGDGTKAPYDEMAFERAADLFINALLIESGIGNPPHDAIHDPAYTTKMSVLDIYRSLLDGKEDGGQDGEDGEGDGSGQGDGQTKPPPPRNFDTHLKPGEATGTPQQQAMDRHDAERWGSEVQAAMEAAQTQGKLPRALEMALGKLREAETNYKDLLRSLLDRTVGTGAYDWRSPDRRMITRDDPIIAPGRRGFRCGTLVLIGDSSGSINPPTVDEFMAQAVGILEELEPARILFAWCDAKVHGWHEITSYADIEEIHKAGVKGRGGTDFCPVFEELDVMGEAPDCLIYLTDLYGRFPDVPPPYQVIWGRVGSTRVPPFGDVVDVPVRAV